MRHPACSWRRHFTRRQAPSAPHSFPAAIAAVNRLSSTRVITAPISAMSSSSSRLRSTGATAADGCDLELMPAQPVVLQPTLHLQPGVVGHLQADLVSIVGKPLAAAAGPQSSGSAAPASASSNRAAWSPRRPAAGRFQSRTFPIRPHVERRRPETHRSRAEALSAGCGAR